MYQKINDVMKGKVLMLLDENLPVRKISSKLGIAKSTIHNIKKKHSKQGNLNRKQGSGRPMILSDLDITFIADEKEKEKRISAPSMRKKLKEKMNISVSDQTIRNYLKNLGYVASSPAQVPLLTIVHKRRRLEQCKIWNFEPKTYWNDVIFSDEVPFNMKNSDGKSWVWRKPGERYHDDFTNKKVKYGGGKVMLWGCFSARGVGKICIIKGKMNSEQYVDILSNNLFQSVDKFRFSSFKFVQDNDPKHTSKYTKEYFRYKKINVLPWPSNSPDLNPIENLWAYLKGRIVNIEFKKPDDLFTKVKEEWESIPVEICLKLVDSMKKRILEVINAKGGSTKY